MSIRKKVAILMLVNKEYDRQMIAGISKFAIENDRWSVYLEDDARAKIPAKGQWRGHGIIADLDDRAIARTVARLRIPVVGLGGFSEKSLVPRNIPYVASDSDVIGRIGADHLLACRMTRFAFCGVRKNAYNSWSVIRERAFVKRLAAFGFDCSVYRGRQSTARKWESLQDGLVEWLDNLETPLGLMACDDVRARHIVEACHSLGRRIPDDVAVLGVDNDPMMCMLSTPPLTSIEQGTFRIGYLAASLIDRMMRSNRKVPRWTIVKPVGVIERQSTSVLHVANDDVRRALQFIRNNVRTGIQVMDVARHVDLSRTKLEGLFARFVGRSTHEEIRNIRVTVAQQLLVQTSLPLRVIAEHAGFGSEQYFSTAFRKLIGVTPGNYRLNARQDVTSSS